MKQFKKILASFMIMCLVIGMVPASAFTVFAASEEPIDAAIIFSDAHTTKSDYKQSTFSGIFGALKKSNLPFSTVVSAGDVFSVNEDSGKYTGKTSTVTSYIQSALGNTSIPVYYVWSDHDRYGVGPDDTTLLSNDSGFIYGSGSDDVWGNENDSNYYIFSLSMADMSTNNRYGADFHSDAEVTEAIKEFSTVASKLNKDRPLLITSHQPLFDRRNDNGHAAEWFEAINKVAEDMDVAFFFGHNHNYDQAGDYIYEKGDTMAVCQRDHSSKNETLNFTHLCAGYMSPSTSNNYTRKGTAMAVAIYDDSVVYTTYNSSGVYSGNYSVNLEVARDHAPEESVTPTIPAGYALNSIEVVNTGGTKYFVGTPLNTEDMSVMAVYTKEGEADFRVELAKDAYTVSGYDANTLGKQHVTASYEGLMAGFTVEVFQKTFTNAAGDVTVDFNVFGITALKATSKVKDVEGYSAYVTYDITPTGYAQGTEATVTIEVDTDLFDENRQVIVLDNGTRIAAPSIVDGKITFTTNHFSEYDVIQADIARATWTTIPGENKTIFRLTDSLTSGEKYVIVNRNTAGNGNAVNLNGSSINSTGVTVIADNDGNYIETPATSAQWTYADNNFVNVGNSSSYLRGRSSTGSLRVGNSSSFYITWKYTSNYGLNNNNESYNLNSSFSLASRSTDNRVYIYEEETMSTAPTYVTMTGQTVHNIAVGQYANSDAVEDMVKDKLNVYIATKTDKSDAETTDKYTIEGTVNPSTAGTTKLTVKYGNTTLGTVTVNVVVKVATDIEVNPTTFTVERDTPTSTKIGTITVYYEEDAPETIDLTVDMLQGTLNTKKNGTYSNLSVTYGGKTESGLVLKVVNKTGVNDFPTYPNAGSVDLKKTAKGVDFQNTGVARVELSASGLPSEKGVDVVVVIDTSSSMEYDMNGNDTNSYTGTNTRYQIMKRSVQQMLTKFQTANTTTGVVPDIDIAIIDFNGYSKTEGSKDYINNASLDNQYRTNIDNGRIYTNGNNTQAARIETLNGGLTANHFMKNTDINITSMMSKFDRGYSGTNYDAAFQNAYDLLAAKQVANAENNETREQYVIFMSDGASFRYNGFMTGNSGNRTRFDQWLDGIWKDADELKTYISKNNYHSSASNLAYLYNGDGNTHPHRMAEAIKGDPSKEYDVVLKTNNTNPNNPDKPYLFQRKGLGAKIYSIGFCMQDDSSNGTTVKKQTLIEVIKTISSGEGYYIENATNEDQLKNAFDTIVSQISVAASNARFIDQMGSSFNLQMDKNIETNATGSVGTTTTNTDITVVTHPVYTQEDYNNKVITDANDIGKPYGSGTTVEKVSFKVVEGKIVATTNVGGYKLPDGTTVVANETNILYEDIIYGKNFFYNASTTEKTITLANGSTYKLPAETFYWNIGTINEVQYTLSYTVRLDGAMEGYAQPGSYDTNNFAILYYTNHVENEVSKSVASPTLAWKGAQVSYAFYLVNDYGQPLHADGTVASNFLQAYKVTQPVVYKHINLNAGERILATQAANVLPEGYTLYDDTSSYTVNIGSGDGEGAHQNNWVIEKGGDKVASTYVMGYAGVNDYSKDLNVSDGTYDYTHTTVYFAVKWTVGTIPDTVVIDYGLDVNVNVMANDMFGGDGTLEYVGTRTNKPGSYTTNPATGFAKSVDATFGTATVEGDKVRYSLNKDKVDSDGNAVYTKGMQMNDAETLSYAAYYNGSANKGYYYGDLTVIPATTVYYEDEYVSLKSYTKDATVEGGYKVANGWTTSSKAATELQGEDRPGQFSLGTIDANNIYGFDGAYDDMSTFSMNNAAMMHVDANQYGTAEFEFYGTGFDVVSATTNMTGTIAVKVVDENNKVVKDKNGNKLSYVVDTYYGYKYGLYNVVYEKGADGLWAMVSVGKEAAAGTPEQSKENLPANAEVGAKATIVHYTWKPLNNSQDNIEDGVLNDPTSLYQVPVIKVDGLTYGKYKVVITATYFSVYDSTYEPGYDLYLDAIRIYNPAGTTSEELGATIENAYKADGEYRPSYFEVRNLLIKASTIKNLSNKDTVEGVIFIDGNEALSDDNALNSNAISDYISYGPNNELYLAKGQAVAFDFSMPALDGYDKVVRIGLKTVGGKSAMAEMWNTTNDGTKYNTISDSIDTATDMYYDITPLEGGTVVITNTGEEGSILSVTNIKTTYKPAEVSVAGLSEQSEPEGEDEQFMFSISARSANAALMSLRPAPVSEPEEDTPEVNNPDVDEPEINNPEVDEPEVNNPDTEKPEANKPGANKPGANKPGANKTENNKPVVNKPGANKPGNNKAETINPSDDDSDVYDPYVDDSAFGNSDAEDELTFVQIIKNFFNSIKNFFINLFNKLF